MEFLLVFLGGGIGSAARHGANILATRVWGFQYPLGTLSVNIIGSFAMGAIVEYWALKSGMSANARLFLTTGVLGGFTTFSTFSLEAALLAAKGGALWAGVYIAASVVLGIGGLYAGMALVRWAT